MPQSVDPGRDPGRAMSPARPVPIHTDPPAAPVVCSFLEALEAVIDGRRATKIEWNNPDVYMHVKGEFLMIHTPTGDDHAFMLRTPDLTGRDWVILS